jgi:hypothetical protein
MSLRKQCFIILSLLLIGFSTDFTYADTFLVGGNRSPIAIETEESRDHFGTAEFQGALVIDLGDRVLNLFGAHGRLWDYDEQRGEYGGFEVTVDAQQLFDELYGTNSIFYMQKKLTITLKLVEGHQVTSKIPLDSKKKYFLVEGMAGEYFTFGSLNFQIPKIQLETQLGLSLEDKALFFTGDLSGLGAFLSPISMAGFGIAMNPIFKFVPKTTFEINPKEMIFNGQTAIVGSAGIPKLPISLTGEMVTQYSGPLFEQSKLGFNGELVAAYKFSAELGLSLHLGNASAFMKKPTLLGSKENPEITFSGVQDPKFSFLPKEFPLQPGSSAKIAGRISSDLKRSYFVSHTDFEVLNIPLSQGRMRIDKVGVVASGFMKTPVSKISFSGSVKSKKVAFKGSAQARLDIEGLVKKVEQVTNGSICGYEFARSGARCGYNFVFGGIGCAVAKLTLNKCQKQCRLTRIGGPRMGGALWTCEMGCFARVESSCKKAKKCKFPRTCQRVVKIPNQRLGYISADIGLLISNSGLGGSVKASFCPLKSKCARLPAGNIRLDTSNIKRPKVCIAKGVAGSNKGMCVGI